MKAILKKMPVFMIIVLVYACSKNKEGDTGTPSLTGKWRLTETLQDPGDGSGKYTPVAQKPNYDYVEFAANGKLNTTAFPGYVKYKVKDSVDVAFYKADSTLQYYRYKFHDGVLDMSPDGPIRCFEPCGSRFVNIDN